MTSENEERKDDRFSLPPPTKKMRAFSICVFFLAGLALGAFLGWNPFDISFLPSVRETHVHHESAVEQAVEESPMQLWTCPMHPQVLEEEPGTCPLCNMKLVQVEPREEQRSSRGTGTTPVLWTCPMDPQVVEKEPGTCPICNMKLVKTPVPEKPAAKTAGTKERKVLYWRAPMDPSFISDRPGKSPMGMDLVPVYQDEGGGGASETGIVTIDPVIVQQIGVRTEAVHVGELKRVIRTVGIVDYNEKDLVWVNTKFDGWIEKVFVNYIGDSVKKGQKLFEIYSPELVSTQEEYLTAEKYLQRMNKLGTPETARQARALMEATRKRLANWDIGKARMDRLKKTGLVEKTLPVVSPVRGRIIEKMDSALEGMFVKAGMNLYKIADLSTVWVHAELYESQVSWVKPGLEAKVKLPSLPGETFSGKVLYLYPFVSEKTRTMKACIEIRNPDRKLEPGMYADVSMTPAAAMGAVLVPEDAVIRTGERNVVFVARGEGRFQPRVVRLGAQGEGRVFQVTEGLNGGEEVVVSAQFLLDSESRLQEFIRKLTANPDNMLDKSR